MFREGDHIIYGGEGVCRVEAIGPAPIAGADKSRTYYTLVPLYQRGVIYAPTDISVRMRPVISADEAWALINNIPNMASEYARPADAKQALADYRAFLETYECEDLLNLIRMIYIKNESAITQGKNYSQTDDKFLKKARELLYGELAVALGIPAGEVEKTIVKAVEAIQDN